MNLESAAHDFIQSKQPSMLGVWEQYAKLEELSRHRLAEWWIEHELLPPPGTEISYDEILTKLEALPKFRPFLMACVSILAGTGLLRMGETGITAGPRQIEPGQRQDLADADAGFGEMIDFLEAFVEAYGDILTGQRKATDILLPNLSLDRLKSIYQGNRLYDYFNAMTARLVAHQAGESAPSRIVEIGAGTGSTTARVLEALTIEGLEVSSYLCTDITPFFVGQLQSEFSDSPIPVEFASFDIEQSADSPLIPQASVDILIAANVFHACRSIREVLSNAHRLLKPGGIILLYEITSAHDLFTLTYGTLDGWFHFTDGPLRIPHSPLLTVPGWFQLMEETGFTNAAAFGTPGSGDPNNHRQAVIVAQTNKAS